MERSKITCVSSRVRMQRDHDLQQYDVDVLTSVAGGAEKCHLVCNNRDYGPAKGLLPINLMGEHGGHCKLTHCPHNVPDTFIATASRLNDEAKQYLSVLRHARCPNKFYCN